MLFKEIPDRFPGFMFTEEERLSGVISDDHFREIVFHAESTVHDVYLTQEDFGEFVFLTASWSTCNKKEFIGFYGLGFHSYGQAWLVDQWRFYSPKKREVSEERNIPKDWLTILLRQRKQNIRPLVLATPVWSIFRLLDIWEELSRVGDNYLLSN